jgi:hypothetical protein
MLEAFPNCIDFCIDAKRDSLWAAIRDRPDAVVALMEIARDPSIDGFTKSNAILRAGSTGQAPAYRSMLMLWAELPPKDGLLPDISMSLGRNGTELPRDVYAGIERFLRGGDVDHSRMAVFILADRKTPLANAILTRYRSGDAPCFAVRGDSSVANCAAPCCG